MNHAGTNRGQSLAGRHVSLNSARGWVIRPVAMFAAAILGLGLITVFAAPSQAADPCTTGNAIACENSKPGSPASEWDITGDGDDTIEGFATDMSVNVGGTVSFKIHAEANYTLDIYRMGYYGGDGARKITSLTPNQTVSKANQPSKCVNNSSSTGLIDCGTWGVSASWAVPSTAVSGIYFAHIVRTDTGADNHVMFVVRNDASHSDMIYQTSDTTWQAYNNWGGNSLYAGEPVGRAYKVSYNRPFNTRGTPGGRDFVWANEYPMVRFLESQGYDVSYQSGLDTDRSGSLLLNHKIFMSVGHDEYWSGAQRKNVEAARDAGVNLAFFSGNEVYWKTRYENSVDGSNTPYRTLVTYKETTDNVREDPLDLSSNIWTGTWRDPRFSPPTDGGRPENSLTGTIFTVNSGTEAIKVPAADGKMRFWRNTAVGSQSAGATYTLPMNTLGYEWDEDLDNGSRPAGLIDLSTSNYDVPEKLVDYGSVVAPGNATHHLTLYRAASGALVFGAGTVQWTWGLDSHHDGATTATDQSMRQGTVNLFADMGAQPTTLTSDLVAASKSTDTTAPTTVVSSPASGARLNNGSKITVTGTSSDVGGQVGGVEVSMDAGQTWHPATGRASWSYTGLVVGNGATSIRVRATDDSANTASPTIVPVTVSCPCALFQDGVPASPSDSDTSEIEMGTRFQASVDGYVTGITFYKGVNNTGTHTGTLWTDSGTQLATGTFTGETATGWQTMSFTNPVHITAGTTYVASYHAPKGGYATTSGFFDGVDSYQAPLSALRTTSSEPNGVYDTGPTVFPRSTFKGANYWVSPIFNTTQPADTTPPTVTAVSPSSGASSVSTAIKPTVTFSEPIKAGTLNIQLSSPGGLVAGTTTFDSGRLVATFTPSAALTAATTYTLTTSGGTDDAGNALTTPTPSTFRTGVATTPGVCPCSIWPDSEVPAITNVSDSLEVELGVKFQADQNGYIDGIRFYKGTQNVGTHTGTLWTSTGTQLATVTFTGESSSGWQQALFSSKVPVTAGITYVASYNTAGYYSATTGELSSAVVNSPLTALADGQDGPNGVYNYGAHSFPGNSAGGTSYGVDVVFEDAADTTPPGVVSTSPTAGATSVPTSTSPTATFTEKVASGLTATLKTGSTAVPSTVALDATGKIATVTPGAALAAGTVYTVTLSGAKDAAGNTMTAYSWNFTTSGGTASSSGIYPSDYTPAVTSENDTSALELGVRFTPSTNGYVTGVRFYKGTGNTGTHVGSLWTTGGSLVSSATFTSETTSGWQQVTFAAPVAVTAGTSYIASYSDPTGHYAADVGQFATARVNGPLTAPADAAGASNGIYATTPGRFPTNTYQSSAYGVDVAFTSGSATDTVPPGVVSTNPVDGATGVPLNQAPVATFNEGIATGSVTASITGPSAAVVPSTVTVGADQTVTITPTAALANNTKYTVKVSASDLAGNAMTSPFTWSYSTAKAVTTNCPCSLWTDDSTPAIASDSDTRSVEVGVNFSPAVNGYINGIRFYKGAANTGTHVGTLWSSTGAELAKATFTGESAAGWQEVSFATPVAVTAGTTYVASYHADNGGFSATLGGLANVAVTRGPLTAPAGTSAAPNGVYTYGARAFPTSGSTTNYWVDVDFDTTPGSTAPADTTPPTVGTQSPASGATAVAATSTVSGVFSEPVTSASVQLTVKDGSTAVAGATAYDSTTRKATFTPTASLPAGRTLTATLQGTDTAGNAMTAPASWTFTVAAATADTTPPTVSAVTATGSGTSATVTWTTNESSTSVVKYGTSATSLTSSATTSGNATAHSVSLTGLTANTRYYYRVTSVDAAGNSATSPATSAAAAQYAPSVTPISQTSTADFTAGTVSSAYVTARSGGGVVLAPAATTEFTGTTVPSTWSSTSLVSGSSVTVSGGAATVSGRLFRSTATYSTSRQISAVATFKAVSGQWLGATDGGFTGATTHWAAFRTSSTGGLAAETDNGLLGTTTTNLSSTLIGASHLFEVDWTASATVFKVDGTTVATQTRGVSSTMYAAAQDATVDANPLLVSSVWVTPYAATGTFTSSVIDAGASVAWGTFTPTATIPTGTTLTYQVRTGPTATAGGTGWSAFTTVAAGAKISGTQRYLQYKATLTTTSSRNTSPALSAVQIGYTVP